MSARTENLQSILIDLLAAVDILWTPYRRNHTSGRTAAAIEERRQQYRRTGLSLVGGGVAWQRQEHFRALQELREAGMVAVAGCGRARAVKLTDKGDDVARSMCPTFRVDEVWELLERVAAMRDAGMHQAGHVLEHDLLETPTGEPPDVARAFDLEDNALSFLARGWMGSASDHDGRVGYAITPAGRAALAAGCPKPSKKRPKYDPRIGQAYSTAYVAGLEERETWEPENTNHVVVPLSCGLWPVAAAGSEPGGTP